MLPEVSLPDVRAWGMQIPKAKRMHCLQQYYAMQSVCVSKNRSWPAEMTMDWVLRLFEIGQRVSGMAVPMGSQAHMD